MVESPLGLIVISQSPQLSAIHLQHWEQYKYEYMNICAHTQPLKVCYTKLNLGLYPEKQILTSKQPWSSDYQPICPHFLKMSSISSPLYGPHKDRSTQNTLTHTHTHTHTHTTHTHIPQTHYWVMLAPIINSGNCDQTSVSLMICTISKPLSYACTTPELHSDHTWIYSPL